MTKRSVTHATFTIERHYNATPARVFAALSQVEAMKRWFGGPPEWTEEQIEMDFRVGGALRSSGGPKGGPLHVMDARYWDIIPDARIVYSYALFVGDTKLSVSLASQELFADGKGTRFVFTEQGQYFDGYDDAGKREEGTRLLLDSLGREVERQS